MSDKLSEIAALQIIDETLEKVDDTASRKRIIEWIFSKYADASFLDEKPLLREKTVAKKKKKVKKNKPSKKKVQVSIIKDLSLSPKGKKSFKEFRNEKKPISHYEKITFCVYYLTKILGIDKISLNHIYTCYKAGLGKGPNDYKNMLHQTGSKGWLDTKDGENILITPIGEDIIEHDLPKKSDSK